MITDRDRLIISHLEKYKYATIDQLQKIFFREQNNSYNLVRRRMAEIIKAGYAASIRDIETNKVIYMYNERGIKPPSRHRIITLDVLANLHYERYNVIDFEVEKEWMNGKVRSDAFAIFSLDLEDNLENGKKRRFQYFVEVHLSNNDCNLEKYDDLYKTGEVQRYLGRDLYPRILLITDTQVKYNTEHCKVLTLNTKLEKFSSVILPDI